MDQSLENQIKMNPTLPEVEQMFDPRIHLNKEDTFLIKKDALRYTQTDYFAFLFNQKLLLCTFRCILDTIKYQAVHWVEFAPLPGLEVDEVALELRLCFPTSVYAFTFSSVDVFKEWKLAFAFAIESRTAPARFSHLSGYIPESVLDGQENLSSFSTVSSVTSVPVTQPVSFAPLPAAGFNKSPLMYSNIQSTNIAVQTVGMVQLDQKVPSLNVKDLEITVFVELECPRCEQTFVKNNSFQEAVFCVECGYNII